MGLRVGWGLKMEQEAWAYDRGPGRWLKGVKVGPPFAAAETYLCLTHHSASLTGTCYSCSIFSLQGCVALISTRFHLQEEEVIHCDLHGKLEGQPLLATENRIRVCPQSCSSFKKPCPSPVPKPTAGSKVTRRPLLKILLPMSLLWPWLET